MRRWLLACLALIAAAAFVLWPRGGAVVGVGLGNGAATMPEDAPAPAAAPRDEGIEALASRVAAQTAPAALALPAAPTTRLSVQVLAPGGRPWIDGILQLWTSGELEPRAFDQERPRSFAQDTPRGRRYLSVWRTGDEGKVAIDGIAAGGSFELRCIDALGNVGGVLEGAALDPSEAREIVLRLARHPTRVEGRCLDERGLPLERVRVAIVSGGPHLACESDVEGRFATAELFGDEVELDFRRRGLAVRRERVPMPPPTPFDLMLSRARVMTVTLVDERGVPFTLSGLQARATDGHTTVDTHPERRETDFVFESMPRTAVTLEIEGCGSDATLDVDADTEQVRWSLPRPGRLEVARGRPPPDVPPFPTAELRHADSGELVFSHSLITSQLHTAQRWTLFPGRYSLQFFATSGLEDPQRALYGPSRTFEILSGETVVLTLDADG
jgi:hypothetical protein